MVVPNQVSSSSRRRRRSITSSSLSKQMKTKRIRFQQRQQQLQQNSVQDTNTELDTTTATDSITATPTATKNHDVHHSPRKVSSSPCMSNNIIINNNNLNDTTDRCCKSNSVIQQQQQQQNIEHVNCMVYESININHRNDSDNNNNINSINNNNNNTLNTTTTPPSSPDTTGTLKHQYHLRDEMNISYIPNEMIQQWYETMIQQQHILQQFQQQYQYIIHSMKQYIPVIISSSSLNENNIHPTATTAPIITTNATTLSSNNISSSSYLHENHHHHSEHSIQIPHTPLHTNCNNIFEPPIMVVSSKTHWNDTSNDTTTNDSKDDDDNNHDHHNNRIVSTIRTKHSNRNSNNNNQQHHRISLDQNIQESTDVLTSNMSYMDHRNSNRNNKSSNDTIDQRNSAIPYNLDQYNDHDSTASIQSTQTIDPTALTQTYHTTTIPSNIITTNTTTTTPTTASINIYPKNSVLSSTTNTAILNVQHPAQFQQNNINSSMTKQPSIVTFHNDDIELNLDHENIVPSSSLCNQRQPACTTTTNTMPKNMNSPSTSKMTNNKRENNNNNNHNILPNWISNQPARSFLRQMNNNNSSSGHHHTMKQDTRYGNDPLLNISSSIMDALELPSKNEIQTIRPTAMTSNDRIDDLVPHPHNHRILQPLTSKSTIVSSDIDHSNSTGIQNHTTTMSNVEYPYQEVVRKKHDRQLLPHCYDCPQCRKFYEVLYKTGHNNMDDNDHHHCHHNNSMDTIHTKSKIIPKDQYCHSTNSNRTNPNTTSSTNISSFGRHRGRFVPSETPTDFWELDFIDER